MGEDLFVLVLAVVGWVFALRWAIRTDRSARVSSRVLEEAEKILRDSADDSLRS